MPTATQEEVPSIEALLKDAANPCPQIRRFAANKLEQYPDDPRAVETLFDLAANGGEACGVQWRAVLALGRLGREEALPALLESIRKSDNIECEVKALVPIAQQNPHQVEIIVRCLTAYLNEEREEQHHSVSIFSCTSVAQALGEIGDPSALPTLRSFLAKFTPSRSGEMTSAVKDAIAKLERIATRAERTRARDQS